MHKLWIFNIDEVVSINDKNYSSIFVPKIKNIFSRFFLSLSPGDKIVSPILTDNYFLNYISRVLNLGSPRKWIIKLTHLTSPYSLIDSILSDNYVINEIKKLNKDFFEIEGFIETPKLLKLSKEIGIKLNKSNEKTIAKGFILKMNDKYYFKKIAKKLKINILNGYTARNIKETIKGIKKIQNLYGKKVILKKSFYGGGLGNIHGNLEEIFSKLHDFISEGDKIIIEPFLDVKKVYGSLAFISDKIDFIGIDEQYFYEGKWAGFDYPSLNKKIYKVIKLNTIKLSKFLHKKGVKGYVNIDWITDKKEPSNPFAIELNLRNNGFNYALDFAKKYFRLRNNNIFIKYRENYNTNNLSTKELINFFKKGKASKFFIDSPGAKEGFVLMHPPLNGKAAIGIFSYSKDNINRISDKINLI